MSILRRYGGLYNLWDTPATTRPQKSRNSCWSDINLIIGNPIYIDLFTLSIFKYQCNTRKGLFILHQVLEHFFYRLEI